MQFGAYENGSFGIGPHHGFADLKSWAEVSEHCLRLLLQRWGEPVKLEMGPGRISERDRRPFGTVGLTPSADPFCDIYIDLNYGIPLPDSCVSDLYSNQLLEHLQKENQVFIWNEMWRVMQPGGTMLHRVPHNLGPHAYGDPTHFTVYSETSFRYYCLGPDGKKFTESFSDYGIEAAFVLESQEVNRDGSGWPIEIVGRFRKPA